MIGEELWRLIAVSTVESLYMTLWSTLFAYLFGLPMGLLLVATDAQGLRPMPVLHQTLGFLVNVLRSIPFLILLVLVMPVTRALVGTTIGTTATIVPLVIGAAPFIARLVESSIKEVGYNVIEAAQAMGASPFQILTKVLVPEARPSLLMGTAIALTTILGYSAMAGFVGGGGLGTVAINYGYNRNQTPPMLVTVVILVVIVQIFQEIGMRLAKRFDKRNRS